MQELASVAQLVEQSTYTRSVPGSSPGGCTKDLGSLAEMGDYSTRLSWLTDGFFNDIHDEI